jgi:hypothetical protein
VLPLKEGLNAGVVLQCECMFAHRTCRRVSACCPGAVTCAADNMQSDNDQSWQRQRQAAHPVDLFI